jgi:predicted enzyme related to lactoylglutathione lyase
VASLIVDLVIREPDILLRIPDTGYWHPTHGQGHTMTALGPDFIALQVRDLEASAAFYIEHLGLVRAPVSPEHAVVFATEPITFAVREPLVDLDAVEHLGWGVVIWLKADDPQDLHDEMVLAGVPILVEPFDGPFGRTFTFADPDGYAVTIHG